MELYTNFVNYYFNRIYSLHFKETPPIICYSHRVQNFYKSRFSGLYQNIIYIIK